MVPLVCWSWKREWKEGEMGGWKAWIQLKRRRKERIKKREKRWWKSRMRIDGYGRGRKRVKGGQIEAGWRKKEKDEGL